MAEFQSFVLPVGSAIPGTVAAFMSLCQEVLPTNATVYFGSALPAYTNPYTLQIVEVNGDQQAAEIGQRYRREETFALTCQLVYYDGSPQSPTAGPQFLDLTNKVMDAFQAIALAIGNNPSLTDYSTPDVTQVARYTEVGNFIVTPETDSNGRCAVILSFSLRCQQRVESLSGA